MNDTSGDLASVNKIIESATSQDINAYLKHPAHISVFYNAKCLRGFDLGDNDLGQALPKTYQGLLDVAAATNEGPAVDHDHMVSFNSILMVPESVVHDKLISKHAIKMVSISYELISIICRLFCIFLLDRQAPNKAFRVKYLCL